MEKKIQELLENRGGSYILPFFWQHGETEEVLRDYMRAIHEANIREVCLECRPHPDFLGEQWWHDMDVVMDEARRRGMYVWLLDDSHFPTGYCNGALEEADPSLCKEYLYFATTDIVGPAKHVGLDVADMMESATRPNPFAMGMSPLRQPKPQRRFDTDKLWRVLAFPIKKGAVMGESIDLTDLVLDGRLRWDVPNGNWRVYVEFYTQNGTGRSDYMNLAAAPSVKVLIDTVYEPVYARYKADFGGTFQGFFSDEPMCSSGNGLYDSNTFVGKDRPYLPWCDEMPALLTQRLGADWQALMPLLWDDGADRALTGRVRHAYMDVLSLMVQKNFSRQLGQWCADRGVRYIGHLNEDFNISSSVNYMGDYFRAISGQHMAGIDVIGGGVVPGAADRLPGGRNQPDSTFYHFMLAKLASSSAHLNPWQEGRSLCEIFGAYGWGLGVRNMKPMIDNFMIRGVNHFTPHAFSPKAFPDPDCPPHFYAHGENPQFGAFGQLMAYSQRVCHLISDGTFVAPVALYYTGTGMWSGDYALSQYAARELTEHQIDYDLVTPDLLGDVTDLSQGLTLNGLRYKVLVAPYSEFVTAGFERFVRMAAEAGFPVLFVDAVPRWLADADRAFDAPAEVVPFDALVSTLRARDLCEVEVSPACATLRYIHYHHDHDVYLFSNESLGKTFRGTVTLPVTGPAYRYDPMENKCYPVASEPCPGGTRLTLTVKPYELFAVVFDEPPAAALSRPVEAADEGRALTDWTVAFCGSKEYPTFGPAEPVESFAAVSDSHPEFSGFLCYETTFESDGTPCALVLEDAYESVEVWCNGVWCGRQFTPEFLFDLSAALAPGKNRLRVEVATTLERKTNTMPEAGGPFQLMRGPAAEQPIGLMGTVKLTAVK